MGSVLGSGGAVEPMDAPGAGGRVLLADPPIAPRDASEQRDRASRSTAGGGDSSDADAGTVAAETGPSRRSPERVTPGSGRDPGPAPPAVDPVVPVPAPAPVVAPAPGGVPVVIPLAAAPAPVPAVPRTPLRMELKGLRRVRAAGSDTDQLALRLGAEPAPDLSVRVDLPQDGHPLTTPASSLRLQIAMVAPGVPEPVAGRDPLALRVRVTLSDAVVEDPVLSRTDAAPEAASDTLDLWVPLRPQDPAPPEPPQPPEPGEPEPAPAPPPGESAPPTGNPDGGAPADLTVPVDVVVPVAPEPGPQPAPQTVELPAADPAPAPPGEALPAPIVTVDVGVAPAEEPPPAPEPPPAAPEPPPAAPEPPPAAPEPPPAAPEPPPAAPADPPAPPAGDQPPS
jgi:hypothetical protein